MGIGASTTWFSYVVTVSERIASVVVDPDIDPVAAMERVVQGKKTGYVDLTPTGPEVFGPVVDIPAGSYAIEDVEIGTEFLNVVPNDALAVIAERDRSPLTIAEGIAIALAFPGILREHHSIQLAGSRAGDKRVPALWVNQQGRPRLGWCWAGNPHSWMGIASCARRTPLG